MKVEMDAIKLYILDTVADDYENFEMLLKEVSEQARQGKVHFSREILIQGVEELTGDDYVQTYEWSNSTGRFNPVQFKRDIVDDAWFYVTPKGKTFVKGLD